MASRRCSIGRLQSRLTKVELAAKKKTFVNRTRTFLILILTARGSNVGLIGNDPRNGAPFSLTHVTTTAGRFSIERAHLAIRD